MFIPRAKNEEAKAIAKATAEAVKVQEPKTAEKGAIGPVVSEAQFNKIQGLIKKGIDEGATLVAGGLGRPEGLNRGYYVRPTVFADVRNDMTIAVEEIFGPVLCMIPYDTEEQAIAMANDTVYGLSGYVQSANQEHAQAVARQLRTGMVHVNGAGSDQTMPFGGFKQSGNGREWGVEGIHEFLETKSVFGYATA
jgi:aldehyde dehydrogenase (NAD+)